MYSHKQNMGPGGTTDGCCTKQELHFKAAPSRRQPDTQDKQ